MLKLSEPDLGVALAVAQNLGLNMELMAELLPAGVQGIKIGLGEKNE